MIEEVFSQISILFSDIMTYIFSNPPLTVLFFLSLFSFSLTLCSSIFRYIRGDYDDCSYVSEPEKISKIEQPTLTPKIDAVVSCEHCGAIVSVNSSVCDYCRSLLK